MKRVIKASTDVKTIKSIYNNLFQLRDLIEDMSNEDFTYFESVVGKDFYDRVLEAQKDMSEGYRGKVIL